MTAPTKPTKAIFAAAGAIVSGLAAGLTDGRLTWGEVLAAVALAVTTAGTVYGVTNRPKGLPPGE